MLARPPHYTALMRLGFRQLFILICTFGSMQASCGGGVGATTAAAAVVDDATDATDTQTAYHRFAAAPLTFSLQTKR